MEPLESARFNHRSGLTDVSGHVQLFTWTLMSLKKKKKQALHRLSHVPSLDSQALTEFFQKPGAFSNLLDYVCCHLHNSSWSTFPWVTQMERQKNRKIFPKFKVSLGFYAEPSAWLTSPALSCACVRCQRCQSLMEKMWRAAGAAVPWKLRPMLWGKKKNTLVM